MRKIGYYHNRDKITITVLVILNCALVAFSVERVYSKIFLLNGKVTSIYPQSVVQLKDIVAEQNMHITTSNDPWIYCEIEEAEISQVEVQFSRKIKLDIPISIYYAYNEGFSQERSAGYIARAGDIYAKIELPKGRYNKLRVDIGNAENISYALGDIKIGNSVTQVKNWSIFFMLFAGLLILAGKYAFSLVDFLRSRPQLKNLFLGVDIIFFIISLKRLFLPLLLIVLIRFEFSFLCSRNIVKETVR